MVSSDLQHLPVCGMGHTPGRAFDFKLRTTKPQDKTQGVKAQPPKGIGVALFDGFALLV